MTDREINSMLWRAFHLGLRVMATRQGSELPFSDIGTLVRTVREIAESEATLHDPTDLARRFPDMASMFHELSTLNIRCDRDIAQRIFQGFLIATEIEE